MINEFSVQKEREDIVKEKQDVARIIYKQMHKT